MGFKWNKQLTKQHPGVGVDDVGGNECEQGADPNGAEGVPQGGAGNGGHGHGAPGDEDSQHSGCVFAENHVHSRVIAALQYITTKITYFPKLS